MKNKLLIKCMILPSLLLPDFKIATTAALSQKHLTDCPRHCLPHTATPITTGSSFFTVMWRSAQESGHLSWNQSPEEEKAPHPHKPEASDVTDAPAATPPGIIATPFHDGRKQDHHCRSDLNSLLRRILW